MTAEEFFYNHWQKANKSKFGDYGEYDSDEYAIAFAKDYAALRMQAVVGSASLTEEQIAHQIEMDDEEDSYWEDEDNFQCCDNCDLPDACSDYGCAIQQGLRRNEVF